MVRKMFGIVVTRPLMVDFENYTDGDVEFKKQLIDLMIENLRELMQTLKSASFNNDKDLFRTVCHKIKVTIEMLNDREFSDVIEQLKRNVSDPELGASLIHLSTELIVSLRQEYNR